MATDGSSSTGERKEENPLQDFKGHRDINVISLLFHALNKFHCRVRKGYVHHEH
jgi:hypothetical protein